MGGNGNGCAVRFWYETAAYVSHVRRKAASLRRGRWITFWQKPMAVPTTWPISKPYVGLVMRGKQ